MIVLSLLLIGLTTFIVWLYFETNHSIWLFMSILLLTLILFGLYIGVKSKIIVTDKEIIKKTPFNTKRIAFSEIGKLGIYVASGSSTTDLTRLEEQDQIKWGFLEQKFIYVTKKQNHETNLFKKNPKDMIDFHYRKKLYEFIKVKINAST